MAHAPVDETWHARHLVFSTWLVEQCRDCRERKGDIRWKLALKGLYDPYTEVFKSGVELLDRGQCAHTCRRGSGVHSKGYERAGVVKVGRWYRLALVHDLFRFWLRVGMREWPLILPQLSQRALAIPMLNAGPVFVHCLVWDLIL